MSLWVPEIGGLVDPDSEAHNLIMSIYAGMSKAERRRIQVRVRAQWFGGHLARTVLALAFLLLAIFATAV